MLMGPPPSFCTHSTRWWRRGRTPHVWFGLPRADTSMATKVRARMSSESGVVGMQNYWKRSRRRFAPTTPVGLVVDAHRTRSLELCGQILLRPPRYAHGWPVQSAWLGVTNVGGTPGARLPAPHQVVASWTHNVGMVCTSMTRYVYGHPSTRTNGQWTRRCWDAQMLAGPSPSVCTHITRWWRRGRTPHVWFGLPRPDTSMATQVRARMSSESGVVGLQNYWKRPRRRFAPTTPGSLVVDAHRTRGLDLFGQILLWPPRYANGWPVQAAWLECRNIESAPAVGLHALHPRGRVVDAHRTRGLDFYSQILLWPPKYAHERRV